MTDKQKAHALAVALGATIETGGGRHFEATVMAPRGFHFVQNIAHEIVVAGADDDRAADVWGEVVARLTGETVAKCHPDECPAWVAGACEWWGDDGN